MHVWHVPLSYEYTLPHTNRVPVIILMIIIFLAALKRWQHSSSCLINKKTWMWGSSEWKQAHICTHTHTHPHCNVQDHKKYTCVMHASVLSCTLHIHTQTGTHTVPPTQRHLQRTEQCWSIVCTNPIIIHVTYNHCKLACIMHHAHCYTPWCLCIEIIVIECTLKAFLVMISELLLLHSHREPLISNFNFYKTEKYLSEFGA